MSKKLKDNFDADLYDKELKQFKLKHVDLDLDQINALPDKEVVAPFKAYMKDFIKNATDEDIKRYVDSYGAVKLMVEYFAQPDAKKVSKMNEEEIYEVLGKYLFNKDESVYSQFAKFLKKELS